MASDWMPANAPWIRPCSVSLHRLLLMACTTGCVKLDTPSKNYQAMNTHLLLVNKIKMCYNESVNVVKLRSSFYPNVLNSYSVRLGYENKIPPKHQTTYKIDKSLKLKFNTSKLYNLSVSNSPCAEKYVQNNTHDNNTNVEFLIKICMFTNGFNDIFSSKSILLIKVSLIYIKNIMLIAYKIYIKNCV
eukprot:Mrub_03927.p2 GENE.Mrub_03927~~Mrub_03927.p2  ORF type:complete len:188 (-),score=15.43 Mrub_03927:563-1126(-)